ncbi:MAG: hypothetical protein ACOY3P_10245 [Planctomycetota bacterium]
MATKTAPKKGSKRTKAARVSSRKAGEQLVTVDRRRKDRREKPGEVAVERRALERRAKVNRRRQIDPTTCERDYTDDEVEFMTALDEYKRRSGRMFPTCSEVLEVIRGLGYAKQPKAAEISPPSEPIPQADAHSEQETVA